MPPSSRHNLNKHFQLESISWDLDPPKPQDQQSSSLKSRSSELPVHIPQQGAPESLTPERATQRIRKVIL